MTISRRDIIKLSVTTGAALSIPSVLRAQSTTPAARTVRMVKGNVRIFDPILTTSADTYDHALAIYDTLFGVDANFVPRPQMVGKWGVSDDQKTYTFELRDGLRFHDGSPVTAADCVASIRRWGNADSGGKVIMARARDISKKDDKTFSIVLEEPLGLLIDILAAPGGLFPAIMREKDADRPATEQVTANIGSGPLKFNEALAKPGASFTYDRNEQYVPRKERPDGFAGGKIVNIDRVIWDNIADQQTALAALQAGEIDFLRDPPFDLLPIIENDPNLALQVLNRAGDTIFLRMNCLQKPFNNVKARQAMLHLIDQEAILQAAAGSANYTRTVHSLFGVGTPYTNDENTGWFKKGGDPEKARQLFKEAGYAGEKVVMLDSTEYAVAHNANQIVAAELRKIGVNAELATTTWSELVTRRAKKEPVENGGWSIFVSSWSGANLGDPLGTPFFAANGDKAWYGWPKDDEYEAVRAKWVDTETLDERKALAREMQRRWWDFVGAIMLGNVVPPIAHRKTLTGLIGVPKAVVPMWNMRKG
ncbi:peptide ABC transporter substrate-binding protein [Microvirga vignae]|uniref:Peptide ABC transporter substrate-binding protein n=1 Tax=Microvirga vignae TaxID=1225564 RepID=A0A0H1RIM7_9HYPH|nr:ABC transporter substrate-binding protein [Microvirga vignae]KLK92457.1 peptide ABC transporter substrate-binding protein [Microvirga vignae]